MEWFVRGFVKASLVWLALGVTLGVGMAAVPAWIVYRPAHMHMNLLGFVAMMIYGVAYHVIPRFTGNPLYSRRLAAVHWWMSNAGLLLMVVGFSLRPHVGIAGDFGHQAVRQALKKLHGRLIVGQQQRLQGRV